jgi:7-cyano-7-deazaguanine synthase
VNRLFVHRRVSRATGQANTAIFLIFSELATSVFPCYQPVCHRFFPGEERKERNTMEMSDEKKKAVVLLSGGMDSAVVLAMAILDGFEAHALTFFYGQRHAIEIEFARRTALALGASRHVVFDLNLGSFGGSALTTGVEVPKGRSHSGDGDVPVTYVPARNAVFLSVAVSLAEAIGARDVFIGVSAVDYSGYPDCRPGFIRAFETAINAGTCAGIAGRPFRIHAPLLTLSKEETVRAGVALGVDFGLTRSCYDPALDGTPCGACDSCRLRAFGFEAAGASDPAVSTVRREL